jgi:predicted CXXCH cytochrome family protein
VTTAGRRFLSRFATPLCLLVAGGCLSLSSCATVERTVSAPPQVEGATFVGNAACADCHTNYTRTFAASAHGRFHSDSPRLAGQTGCESCHGPGSKHVQSGGQGREKFIVNPRKSPDTCFACHLQTHAEFRLPHHHQVLEGRMHCGQCHDAHGFDIRKRAGGQALARLNETCADCHREQHKPHVFVHEALREGCVACHAPHGSFTQKLLHQCDANLCLKCHAQVQTTAGDIVIGNTSHGAFLRRGTCWAAGCHTAVHGSNIDPRLRY